MRYMVLIIVALLVYGCNNDIFIENTAPSRHEVTVDGDGGTASIRYIAKGLRSISIDQPEAGSVTSIRPKAIYYDAEGNVIDPDCVASEVNRIRLESLGTDLVINITGKRIDISSIECAHDYGYRFAINLNYDHDTQPISVTVSAGQPMTMSSYSYDLGGAHIDEVSGVYSRVEEYITGSDAQTIRVMPYDGVRSTVTLIPDDPVCYRRKEEGMFLPTYVDGRLLVDESVSHDVILGESIEMTLPDSCQNIVKDVQLQPYSRTIVNVRVKFVDATIPYRMKYYLPASQRETTVRGDCQLRVPSSYEILIRRYSSHA